MLTHHRYIGTIGYMGGIMSVPEPFCFAWGQLIEFTHEALCGPDEHIFQDRTKLSLHDYGRNDLLSRMRGDWILMLDTDEEFEPDLAARMVRLMMRHDLDVVTGTYPFKKAPHFPVIYAHNQETDRHEIFADGWKSSVDLIEIDSAGAGVLLIRRRACERITAALRENPFDRYPGKGEDHSFFIRLRKVGLKAYWAPKIEVSHLEYVGLRVSRDYQAPEKFDREYVMKAI
jgi:hypothetical protein